jgi:DNA-binding transcriptional regulator YhcF (GntR family)/CheY-like chemotaxis protein
MRFWLTPNSEVPIRQQLIRQVVLGILSAELPPGERLPSVRRMASRHRIHANTVSAAYHELVDQGWLENRRGSGVYVRGSKSAKPADLDSLITQFLKGAQALGFDPEAALARMRRRISPRTPERILVAEDEAELRAILEEELRRVVAVKVSGASLTEVVSLALTGAVVAAIGDRASALWQRLPESVPCVFLRVRAVREVLEGETRPAPDALISIASRSPKIRKTIRDLLNALGIDPVSLQDVDSGSDGWQSRILNGSLIICDALAAAALPVDACIRELRILSDASLEEVRQLCGLK